MPKPTLAPDDLLAWEQQPREPPKAFHAFCHYREMSNGARSIDRAWRDHLTRCDGKPQPTGGIRATNWHNLSAEWGWPQRVALYDRSQDVAVRAKILKDQTEARGRHARMAQAALQVLTIPSRVMMEAIQDPAVMQRMLTDAKTSSRAAIKLIDLISWASKGIPGLAQMERLALGLTTDVTEVGVVEVQAGIGTQVPIDPVSTDMAIALLDRLAGTAALPPKVD